MDGNAFNFSDAAKRISDVVTQAIADRQGNRWMAFALEDGASNGTVFDTKADAIRHHRNAARQYMYLKIPLDYLSPRAAEVFLKLHRQLKALGQHPDDEMIKSEYMFDNRREAYPELDARRILVRTRRGRRVRNPERRSPGGLILP